MSYIEAFLVAARSLAMQIYPWRVGLVPLTALLVSLTPPINGIPWMCHGL